MYWVYILYSEKDTRLYVGCTYNLQERMQRHENGYVRATRFRRPLKLIHTERFQDKTKAFNRERFLKSLWGSREKRKIKQKYLDTLKNNNDYTGL